MERFSQAVIEVFSDDVSRSIVILIFGLFAVSVVFGIIRRFSSNDQAAYRIGRFIDFAPGAMTTIGVIGTFIGIFFGLIEFDVENIDESVPNLLSGLKIAFGTSIVGMFSSILFRLLEQTARMIFGSRPTGDFEDDPIPLLNKMNELLEEQNKSLGGDGDSSILTTLRLSRSDANDSAKKQIETLQEFAETLKESATGAIIKALEDVIRDFNNKINEQFGENFKQLNQAVGALNTWQENYREQVEQTEMRIASQTQAIGKIQSGISQIVADFDKLNEQAQVFPEAAEKMNEANSNALDNFRSMKSLLESLAGIQTQAEGVLPEIEISIDRMVKELRNASEKLADTIASQTETLTSKLEESADELNIQIKQSLDAANKGTIENFKQFDASMEKEITKVLEEMGTNLTSLSGKFVEDYTPLTEKLRDLVRVARGIEQ